MDAVKLNQNIEKAEPSPEQIQYQIDAQKLMILYQNLWISMPANIICSTLVFFGQYWINHISFFYWSWYVCLVTISLLRLASAFFYQRTLQCKNKFYSYLFVLEMAAGATLWGILGSVLMPVNLLQQMIVMVIIAGVSAGGTQSLQPRLFANIFSLALTLLPLIIWVLLQGTINYFILGIAFATYFFFMIMIARRGYHLLHESLELHYTNGDLVDKLLLAKRKLENMIRMEGEYKTNLQKIINNSPIGMAIVSMENKWSQVNDAFSKIVGYNKTGLEGLALQDLIYPDDLSLVLDAQKKLSLKKTGTIQLEIRFSYSQNQPTWTQLNITLVYEEDMPAYYIFQIQDITERIKNEKALTELNKNIQFMLIQLQEREKETNIINKANKMLQMCQTYDEVSYTLQLTAEELFPCLSGGLATFNKTNNVLEVVKQWGDKKALKKEFKIEDCWALRGGYVYRVINPRMEVICQHFTATPEKEYLCIPLMVQDGSLGMIHLYSSLQDGITEQQFNLILAFSEISKLALSNISLREMVLAQTINDPLTGLFNQAYLNKILPARLEKIKRKKSLFYVSLLEIKNFKNIQEKYGNLSGDEVIKFVTTTLKQNFPAESVICRYENYQFLVLFDAENPDAANLILEKLVKKIEAASLILHNQQLPKLNLYFGLVIVPTEANTPEEIITRANKILFSAKQKRVNGQV